MSNRMKTGSIMRRALIGLLLCALLGSLLPAFAEEDPASEAYDVNLLYFWLCGDYTLYPLVYDEGETVLTMITLFDEATGDETAWIFQCEPNPNWDFLQATAYSVEARTYDEDNLLVQSAEPEQPCKTRFVVNEEHHVVIQDPPDAQLEGLVFLSLDEAEPREGDYFTVDDDQEWYLQDTPFESWERFRPVTLDAKVNWWYWIYKLPKDVYALYEPYQEEGIICYLILGEDRALLWDTGMGIANIRNCVDALTDLPVTVLNSHDHFDHTGGNYLFEQVMCYNIPSAIQKLTEGISHEEMMEYVDPDIIVNTPPGFDPETYCRVGKAPTATVEEGQIIDLGGRQLEVLYTPGHSSSSIMLIDEANGLLFTGDTWYPGPLYAFMEDCSLTDYVESMHKAGAVIRERNIQWLYCSHNEIVPGTDLFFQTEDFLEDVLNGKVDYEIEDGMRVYTMDDLVSLWLNDDEAELEDEEEP